MLTVLPGCGDSDPSPASEAQLEAAKREGEVAARERDRIDDLQLGGSASSTGVSAPDSDGGTTVLRSFHAPSGNVEPHGIICADGSSGHGFEASRVPERQRVY